MSIKSKAIISKPSPNFDERPDGRQPDMLIMHYTGMQTGAEAIERLCDDEAKVSAHYVIDEDGSVHQLVDEAHRAWHAGVSHWAGEDAVNNCSIGIEIVNPGHEWGYREFPEAQMVALCDLARGIVERHAIAPGRVLGHSDVAPTRKDDPGELFDWPRLAEMGVGLWHDVAVPYDMAQMVTEDIAGVQERLQKLGYGIQVTGEMGIDTNAVLTAFQRHWRPEAVHGRPDAHSIMVLRDLLAKLD